MRCSLTRTYQMLISNSKYINEYNLSVLNNAQWPLSTNQRLPLFINHTHTDQTELIKLIKILLKFWRFFLCVSKIHFHMLIDRWIIGWPLFFLYWKKFIQITWFTISWFTISWFVITWFVWTMIRAELVFGTNRAEDSIRTNEKIV